jgi:hypothetical protein
VIWDLDSTPEIEVLIPFNCEEYWCKVSGLDAGSAEANGYISLYVLEPLTGPTITEAVPIHVFVAGGPDFCVTCPTLAAINNVGFGSLPTNTYNPGTGTDPFPAKTAAGTPDPVYPQMGEEDMGPNFFVLGPMSSSKDAALRSMGEQIVSFREILKRKQLALRVSVNNTSARFVSTYPKSATSIVSFPVGVPGNAGVMTNSPYEQNLMTYLMPMFLGISGSTKWDIQIGGASVAHLKAVRGFGHPQMNYAVANTLDEASYQGMAYSRSDIDGVFSIVSPQYIRQQFTYVASYYQDRYLLGQSPTSLSATFVRDNGYFLATAGASQNAVAYVAAGDDFNLLYFLGPPSITPITL